MVVEGRQPKKGAQEKEWVSPTSRIAKIASLKRFPDKDYARSLLHDVAKAVAPLMQQYNFKVNLLCEMYPKSGNLLGLNVNGGAKIMLRLRYHSNDRAFLPMGDIIGTMLHELTHNVHGPHNERFYKLLDELRDVFEQNQYNFTLAQYVCEENRLGGSRSAGYVSIRDKRLAVLSRGKFKAERRKLGSISKGARDKNKSLRELALEAAERRLRDSKWCHDDEDKPDNSELEIISVEEFENRANNDIKAKAKQTIPQNAVVIDLTDI